MKSARIAAGMALVGGAAFTVGAVTGSVGGSFAALGWTAAAWWIGSVMWAVRGGE